MDKNTLVGFALIGAVVIGFSIYNRPSQEEWHVQTLSGFHSGDSPKRGRTTGTGCHGTESECNIAFRLYLYVLWRKPRYGTANDTGK